MTHIYVYCQAAASCGYSIYYSRKGGGQETLRTLRNCSCVHKVVIRSQTKIQSGFEAVILRWKGCIMLLLVKDLSAVFVLF